MHRVNRIFTPGPVTIHEHILSIGAKQPPYNRTSDFSRLTSEILSSLKYIFQTKGDVALLTGSGTLAMEAAVLNFLTPGEKVLIVNGGTFGQRWCDICEIHSIPYHQINLQPGEDLDLHQLRKILEKHGFAAFLINAHETSTGHLYDIKAIGDIIRDSSMLYIVDAISTICADPFQMDDWNVDIAILSSQKALALPPGLSFVAMGARAIMRLRENRPKTLYMDLQNYLTNQERGQVPYTPAIGLLLQLHQRLLDIQQNTLPETILLHARRASDFREAIIDLPLSILPDRQSNAITALLCNDIDATDIVQILRDHHHAEVAPSGGDLKHKLIRISHMGDQNSSDIQFIATALAEIIVTRPVERISQ